MTTHMNGKSSTYLKLVMSQWGQITWMSQEHIYTLKLYSITPMATKVHIITEFVVLTWMRDTIDLVQHMTLWNKQIATFLQCGVVHSTWPSREMWHMHAPTFKKKKKKTLHILPHDAMRGFGLTSLVVCFNDEIRDIRKRNVTIRSGI